MESLAPYAKSFSESGMRILDAALGESYRRAQNLISPEHVLYALISDEPELFEAGTKDFSINLQTVRSAVEKRLEKSPVYNGPGFEIAAGTTDLFKASMDRARSEGRRVIEAEDLILAFTAVKKNLFDDILNSPFEKKWRQSPKPRPTPPERTETDVKLRQRLIDLQNENSRFPSNFSVEDVITTNVLLSAFKSSGPSGGGGCSVIGNKIRQNEHLFFGFSLKDLSLSFKPAELIISLKRDIRIRLEQNNLIILKTESSPAGFSVHYRNRTVMGRILIAIEMSSDHLRISVNQDETHLRKK